MISIVYSTREEQHKFKEHLKKSCGIKNIEILEYINNGEYSLTEIYNKGLKESTNDIVVFCHDDIWFNKPKWGKKIQTHFSNSDFGILGVAGTTEIPQNGIWWQDIEGNHLNKVVGVVTHSVNGKTWVSKYSGNYSDDVLETLNLDGLFFVIEKNRIKKNFNEDIKGFHFYDLDFTFNNHLSGVKVGVVYDLKITHKSPGPTNEDWENNRKQFIEIYNEFLPKTLPTRVLYENNTKKINKQPKLSIIIPTKDNIELLFGCINSILNKTHYKNYKIYIADTGSNSENIGLIREKVKNEDVLELVEFDYYNFAQINNEMANHYVDQSSELLLFCNNDIELINDAISEMVNVYNRNKNTVGTVGARLHFGDNSLQHYGMLMFIKREWVQNNKLTRFEITHDKLKQFYKYEKTGYSNVIGNTGALLLINKNLFSKANGFNPTYTECFEDVELNLEVLKLNKTNILCHSAVAYHYESKSRNKDDKKIERLQNDYKERLFPFVSSNVNKLQQHIKIMQ